MEIEEFSSIINIVKLAKELYDIDRFDIVQSWLYDELTYDSWFENAWEVVTSIFSGFNGNYNEEYETDIMIFSDDVISEYFINAWEFGKKTNTPYDKNPYVKEAENEMRYWLDFTYTMEWRLLGYAKSKRAAKESRLIVYACANEFYEYDHLAYGLVKLYKWFSDKCTEFNKLKGEMAA